MPSCQEGDDSVIVQSNFCLHPIVPPVPELVAGQWTADHGAVQHVSFGRWRVSDVLDVGASRRRRRVRILRRVWVLPDQVNSYAVILSAVLPEQLLQVSH